MIAQRIDFGGINAAALGNADALVRRWLPEGRREGAEWVARNPCRADRRPGSFKVNLHTGRWGDFATGERGGDLISLAAFLFCGNDQGAAALKVAGMLRVDPHVR